jgi:hypothetical protein
MRVRIGLTTACIALLAATIASAAPQTAPPLTSARPSGPDTSAYTQVVKCPAKVGVVVAPYSIPAGWVGDGNDGVWRDLSLDTFMGKNQLVCNYDLPNKPGSYVIRVRAIVPLGSCILGPDRSWFLCKPNTLP